jgi:hypothetical protein
MAIRSTAFERMRPFTVCSATRMCGYCVLIGAQKNGLRRLRAGLERLVRPADAPGSRPAECRVSDFSGTRSAARRVPPLWHREARTVGFPADNPDFTKRFAFYVGRRCRQASGTAFTGVLIKNEIVISMDGKGAWRDNVFVERFWRSISSPIHRPLPRLLQQPPTTHGA